MKAFAVILFLVLLIPTESHADSAHHTHLAMITGPAPGCIHEQDIGEIAEILRSGDQSKMSPYMQGEAADCILFVGGEAVVADETPSPDGRGIHLTVVGYGMHANGYGVHTLVPDRNGIKFTTWVPAQVVKIIN